MLNLKGITSIWLGAIVMVGMMPTASDAHSHPWLSRDGPLLANSTPNPSEGNIENTGASSRRGVRYRFECNTENQTVLAMYLGRRSFGTQQMRWRRFGDRTLIQWTDEGAWEFGDNITAEQRCRVVTTKFNQHFLRRQDNSTLPPISEGVLNGSAVVCAAQLGGCSPDNVLWTLKSDNQGTNGRIIAQLRSAMRGEAGVAPILESEDNLDGNLEANTIDMDSLIDELITLESAKLDKQEDNSVMDDTNGD
ncbi:MAG TPA: hypothetical protein IGS52_15215 [Oscillatoriaceae cyanobacterium M33_DOE_052]|uniref:Uncharacterized protein n=1 Tax=Planktothricoides sp. SpSt-374 TaxID=2282167 RepID=A0A7C3VKA6_9CYAN|nr:hypothetical protein [Oscillatoriaceae cyanobacterium M33_DOE_052]